MGGLPYIFMENVDENKLTPTHRHNLRDNKLQQQLKTLFICSLLLSKKEPHLNGLPQNFTDKEILQFEEYLNRIRVNLEDWSDK